MPSEFTSHFTPTLELSNSGPTSPLSTNFTTLDTPTHPNQPNPGTLTSQRKEELHALLVSINQDSLSTADVHRYAERLRKVIPDDKAYAIEAADDKEIFALEEAIIGKLTVALYSDAFDAFLTQAADVEAEAEWWADIEHSRTNVALYLIQTLPLRLMNVVRVILLKLRANHVPLNLASLSPSSLRYLLRSPAQFTLRPSLLTAAFFPYLKDQHSVSLAVLLAPPVPKSSPTGTKGYQRIRSSAQLAYRFVTLPLQLARHECKYNRKALEKIRNERAEVLGRLAELRTPLSGLIQNGIKATAVPQYTTFLDTLTGVVSPGTQSLAPSSPSVPLTELALTIPSISSAHIQLLQTRNLLRPSVLTRLWPSIFILPPLSLYAYQNRTSWMSAIAEMVHDGKETTRGFVQSWLVEPLIGVLDTVRTGGKGEVLVREEGVLADLESLERMALALARDSLNYTPAQLETLATQVRLGDLTPVMQIYEEDIRTPIRSALSGTLLRNLFIQLQKAKVDIDQALSGIDRLLKSQELTFAFVGVAPALAVVYVGLGSLQRLWGTMKGTGNLGGRKRRRAVWEDMRRIERLLIVHSPSADSKATAGEGAPIASLSTGLLILSLTRLRSYALDYLPTRVRTPFLEDLRDLENTNLDRDAKLRIVDRMWKCWGAPGEGIIKL